MSQQNEILNFASADVISMLSVVHEFIAESSRLYNAYNNEPAPNSIAMVEKMSFPDNEKVESVHYGGILSMEAAADHLMVFADSLAEPAKSIAPWTCVRGLLESCALASWFLDPTIDAITRVGRYLGFRYEGFVQQIKLFSISGKEQENLNQIKERMHRVEQDALKLGYPRIRNRLGEIDGIGIRLPNRTILIGKTLNWEVEYRLLSAIAHGHHWATHQVGFRIVEFTDSERNIRKGLEKYINPAFVLYAANIAITSFAQVLWYIWRLYGWNLNEISNYLDVTFDRLKYTEKRRLWRE